MKVVPKRLEWQIQAAIFEWAKTMEIRIPELKLLHGSTGGVRLSIGAAVKAKRLGNKAGFPDIFLPVARGGYHGLFIELKIKPYRNHKNKMVYPVVSKEQRWWINQLNIQGYCAAICKGFDAAIEEILNYIEL